MLLFFININVLNRISRIVCLGTETRLLTWCLVCFSEENVWQLCNSVRQRHPAELSRCKVVFVSNEARVVPLWRQKAGRDEEKLVIWVSTAAVKYDQLGIEWYECALCYKYKCHAVFMDVRNNLATHLEILLLIGSF